MTSQLTYRTTLFSSQNWPKNTSVLHLSFSGKEKDLETGYHYFGARYYNSDLSLWLSVDPMADKYPSLSPYNYCAWNPMRLVDPDGEEAIDDWVKNLRTNQYEWNDNATSPSNTPDGYRYIGDNNALLGDLNINSDYAVKEDRNIGFSPDLGTNYGGLTRSANRTNATISVSVSVRLNDNNISQHNRNGITFDGIEVTGYVNQWSASASGESNTMDYNGIIVVSGTGDFQRQSCFSTPSKGNLHETGVTSKIASVHIPAKNVYDNVLKSATIKLGHASASSFNGTKKFSWSLLGQPVMH